MFSLPLHDSTAKSTKTSETTTAGGDLGVPILTPETPYPGKLKKQKLVAIVTSGIGATFLVAVIVAIVCFCLLRVKKLSRRASRSGSSEPSSQVVCEIGRQYPPIEASSPHETWRMRKFTLVELEHATSNFNYGNVIGNGRFGLVYKGLLQDGSLVAIKRRLQQPSSAFVQEAETLGLIHHRHVVRLVGYCQENLQQFLVYDYEPNGSVGNHLYDSKGLPLGKLDIRQRLCIALGAAKGMEYLHGLVPPRLHMHFRTSNVLVDENYVAKVADAGLSRFIIGGYQAESSAAIDCFLDPELNMSNGFYERSDVHGFGVFLMELISGCDAFRSERKVSEHNLVEQVKNAHHLDDFLDKTIAEQAKSSLLEMLELALQCLQTGLRRPTMSEVARGLELIQEKEMGYRKTAGEEEISPVALGSELFR